MALSEQHQRLIHYAINESGMEPDLFKTVGFKKTLRAMWDEECPGRTLIPDAWAIQYLPWTADDQDDGRSFRQITTIEVGDNRDAKWTTYLDYWFTADCESCWLKMIHIDKDSLRVSVVTDEMFCRLWFADLALCREAC